MAVTREIAYFRCRLAEELNRTTRTDRFGGIIQLNFELEHLPGPHEDSNLAGEVIRSIHVAISDLVRKSDVVSILDENNMLILITEAGDTLEETCHRLHVLSLRMKDAAKKNILWFQLGVIDNISIGLNVFPHDAGSADILLQQTNLAVLKSKELGKNSAVFFQDRLSKYIDKINTRELQIKRAIYSDDFELHFQPQVDQQRSLVGAEVIVRWPFDGKNFWRPEDFYTVLGDTSVLLEMEAWIIETVCKHITDLPANSLRCLDINLSCEHIVKNDLVEIVLAAIQRNNIPTRMIGINVTEQSLSEHLDSRNNLVTSLNALDIELNIREMDVNRLPLSSLARLKTGNLVLDSALLGSMVEDAGCPSKVKALISMAKSLNLGVIADNVSCEAEFCSLLAAGCDRFQGAHISKTLSFPEFQDFVKAA